jgi:hypothetical protein
MSADERARIIDRLVFPFAAALVGTVVVTLAYLGF